MISSRRVTEFIIGATCVAVAAAAVAGVYAMDRIPPHAPAPAAAAANSMRFAGQQQRMRSEAPDWWHYSAPWWSPPTHEATKSPPDFVDTPAYEKYKDPPEGTMAVYVPYGRDAMSWMETGARVHKTGARHHAAAGKKHGSGSKRRHTKHGHRAVRRPTAVPAAMGGRFMQQFPAPVAAAGAAMPQQHWMGGAPNAGAAAPVPRFQQQMAMQQQLRQRATAAGVVPRIWRNEPSQYRAQQAMMNAPLPGQQQPMGQAPGAAQPLYAGVSTGYAPAPEVSLASATMPRFASNTPAPANARAPVATPPNLPFLPPVPESASDLSSSMGYEFGLPSSLQMPMPGAQQPMPPPPGTPEYANAEQMEAQTDAEFAQQADYEFSAHARDAAAGAPVPRIWRIDRPVTDHDEDGMVTDRFEQELEAGQYDHVSFGADNEAEEEGGAAAAGGDARFRAAQSAQMQARAQFDPNYDLHGAEAEREAAEEARFAQTASHQSDESESESEDMRLAQVDTSAEGESDADAAELADLAAMQQEAEEEASVQNEDSSARVTDQEQADEQADEAESESESESVESQEQDAVQAEAESDAEAEELHETAERVEFAVETAGEDANEDVVAAADAAVAANEMVDSETAEADMMDREADELAAVNEELN